MRAFCCHPSQTFGVGNPDAAIAQGNEPTRLEQLQRLTSMTAGHAGHAADFGLRQRDAGRMGRNQTIIDGADPKQHRREPAASVRDQKVDSSGNSHPRRAFTEQCHRMPKLGVGGQQRAQPPQRQLNQSGRLQSMKIHHATSTGHNRAAAEPVPGMQHMAQHHLVAMPYRLASDTARDHPVDAARRIVDSNDGLATFHFQLVCLGNQQAARRTGRQPQGAAPRKDCRQIVRLDHTCTMQEIRKLSQAWNSTPCLDQVGRLGMSMGRYCTAASAVVLMATTASAQPAPEAVIYVAKEIRTLDPARPVAEAVAVENGLFGTVGTLAEVQKSYPNARIDRSLATKVITPGFVEQHVHPMLAALTLSNNVIAIEDWDTPGGFAPGVRDAAGYQRRLAGALKAFDKVQPDKTKPFVTWGYHNYFHGELARATLNRLSPTRPVIVWHRSGHEVFLNDAGLKQTGIDQAFIDAMPAGARAQSSLVKGHLYEQGFIAAIPKLVPNMASQVQVVNALKFTRDYYHRAGITLACEPGVVITSKPVQELINSVYSPDETPFNHCFMGFSPEWIGRAGGDPAKLLTLGRSIDGWGRGRTFMLPGQIKLMNDGAIFSQLMVMKDGYTDGHHGAWIMEDADFKLAFDTYWDAGYQLHIHNNGDGGMDRVITLLAAAMQRKARVDHRTTIVHFGFATPEQVDRLKALGAIISANPYYVSSLATRYAKLGIGPERAANMVPLGDVVRNGIPFSLHSDMPMAPAKPLTLVQAAVTRQTVEGPVAGPQHRVSVEQAMRGITIEAAYSIRQEQKLGTISPGKDANLTILDESPWAVSPTKIASIPVWGTMLEGRLQPVERKVVSAAVAVPALSNADMQNLYRAAAVALHDDTTEGASGPSAP